MHKYISLEEDQGIGLLKFNRPETYNAMNKDMKKEIIKAMKSWNKNPEIKAIIITGEGKAFSSGQDLNDRTVAGNNTNLGKTLTEEWNPLILSIRQSPKIVIAALNGVCAGAGLSVALACDFLLGNESTKFLSGFVKIGLVPDAGSTSVLVRSLGYQKALEFSLSEKPLKAPELLEKGLINSICVNVLEDANELAQKIIAYPPLAIESLKKNLQWAQDHTYEESLHREVSMQRFLGKTNDYKEGVSAFFEKRVPQFQGS